jgi:hypothetical protein
MGMRRVLGLLGLILAAADAQAIGWEPKIADVCSPADRSTGKMTIDRPKLVGQLIEKKVAITSIDLDTSGQDVTFDRKVSGILDPTAFCKTQSTCAKGVEEKLGTAQVFLIDFIRSNSRPIEPGKTGLEIAPSAEDPLRAFLRGRLAATCVSKPVVEATAAGGKPEASLDSQPDFPHFFSLRTRVEDLRIAQSDAGFKKVERASFSFNGDMVQHSRAFGIDASAGYVFGPAPFGESSVLQFIPFASYEQNYVDKRAPAKDIKVFNISTGVIGDVFFPAFGIYHDVQFYPKFVNSADKGTQIISANLVYSPQPDWPLFGQVYYLTNNLSMQITPESKANYGNVLDDGGDVDFRTKGNYFRIGPRLALALYGRGIIERVHIQCLL